MYSDTRYETALVDTPARPSLNGFISWLERKDKNEEYFWESGSVCAGGQYALSLDADDKYFMSWLMRGASGASGDEHSGVWMMIDRLASGFRDGRTRLPRTFGALLDRTRLHMRALQHG